jgi:orotate phosphoribosyltransferase
MKEKLIEMLIDVGALKFGEFTLSSGKKSNIYVDIKHACTHPEILKIIAKLMAERITDLKFDKIACIELGGVPLAVALSLEVNKPYVIFRKEKKRYGVGGDIVGVVNEGESFIVVEDVTTTGRSALSVVERVENKGGKVVAVLTVVDRNEGAREIIPNLIPLLELRDLLERNV